MAFTYTVDELIESIKVRCLVPISQSTFQPVDILRFANEEIELKMIPNILRVKEEFYVIEQTVIASESNPARYPIPYRAIGSKLRLLQYGTDTTRFPLTRVQPELMPYFQFNSTGDGAGFFIEGNDIVVLSKNGLPSGDLIASYYLKPNKLVAKERVGIISSIDRVGDGTNGSVTVSNSRLPTNFTAGGKIDLLEAIPNFRTYSFDIEIFSVNPTTRQVFMPLGDIPANLKVGDHIASAGECITPQIPSELQSMLAQTVACRLLEAMGDINNLKIAYEKLKEMQQNLFMVIDSRTDGNPQKINNVNGLAMRSKIGSRRFRGYKP